MSKFNFYGKIIGKNVSINGRNINCVRSAEMGKAKKFDEKRMVDCSNIDSISIDSPLVDVNIFVSNSFEAHFYGEAVIDGDVNFDVHTINRELRIVMYVQNCFSGNLKLDVSLPRKIFKAISVKSSSADITLSEGILTKYLKVKTLSGDLETNAVFKNIAVSTMSGDVNLWVDAIQDISVKMSTISGDVSMKFNNIGHVNIFMDSISGDVINCHKEKGGFTADVDISSTSGDIRIR